MIRFQASENAHQNRQPHLSHLTSEKTSETLTKRFRELAVICSNMVCTTMLKWTCMERKTGVPIGYGLKAESTIH